MGSKNRCALHVRKTFYLIWIADFTSLTALTGCTVWARGTKHDKCDPIWQSFVTAATEHIHIHIDIHTYTYIYFYFFFFRRDYTSSKYSATSAVVGVSPCVCVLPCLSLLLRHLCVVCCLCALFVACRYTHIHAIKVVVLEAQRLSKLWRELNEYETKISYTVWQLCTQKQRRNTTYIHTYTHIHAYSIPSQAQKLLTCWGLGTALSKYRHIHTYI